MDQLLAIRTFARVVEAGSFTKAADSIQMPKATVTKLVQALEKHVGAKLLQRTTRRISVTPEGMAYYEKTARVVKDLADIDGEFGARHRTPKGICASTSGARWRGMSFFRRYLTSWRAIRTSGSTLG